MKPVFKTVVLLALFAGCKTTKEITETKSKVSETVQNDLKTTVHSSYSMEASASMLETILENDSLVIEETVVEFSAPDSSGKQHPEKITTRKAISGKQTQKQSTASAVSDLVSQTKKTADDNSLKHTDSEAHEAVKKKQVWRTSGFWISFFTVVLSLNSGSIISGLRWVFVRVRKLLSI